MRTQPPLWATLSVHIEHSVIIFTSCVSILSWGPKYCQQDIMLERKLQPGKTALNIYLQLIHRF